ncbi:MAG: hypothetical protein AB7T49_17860 [Oligoflexales bacterium]
MKHAAIWFFISAPVVSCASNNFTSAGESNSTPAKQESTSSQNKHPEKSGSPSDTGMDQVDNPKADPKTEILAGLRGVWKTGCTPEIDMSEIDSWEFTETQAIQRLYSYTGTECKTPWSTITWYFSYSIGADSSYPGSNGAFEVDVAITRKQLLPHDPDLVDDLLADGSFGHTDWEVGVPKDLTVYPGNYDPIGEIRYLVMGLREDFLGVADRTGVQTPGNPPTQFGYSYKKQGTP